MTDAGTRETMVTPARFERATYRLGIWRSILLSYGAVAHPDTGRRRAGLATSRRRQLDFSGGTTGSGKGATFTPSSTSAFVSAMLA